MSIEYINRYYRKEYKVGMQIKFNGRLCTIIGAEGAHLLARAYGVERTLILHPTWRIEVPELTNQPKEKE